MSELIKGAGKSKLRLYLATTLLLALAVTGGLFAYAYTTTSAVIDAGTGPADYADVTANASFPTYTVFGKYRGALPQGYLFNIVPTSGYPGDLAVNVYLDNIDEMGKTYGHWAMRLEIVNSSNVSLDKEGPITKVLSMRNGVVSFVSDNMTPNGTYYIRSDGGVYRAHCWEYFSSFAGYPVNPSLTCEVLQAK